MMAERYSRPNTLEEKRKMRNERKKRKRARAKDLKAQLQLERQMKVETDKKVTLYKNMSRSYWERWQWELQQRKECLVRERALLRRVSDGRSVSVLNIHEIDPDLLHNPTNAAGESVETFIGRGSFGVVRLQLYRGLKVAVKELLPRSIAADVRHEASILAQLCHPYLPFLFGVNTHVRPYRLVMQYHGFRDRSTSVTLHKVLCNPTSDFRNEQVLVTLCIQLMEAVRYLHDEAKVLHNDLKCNNILICDCTTGCSSSAQSSSESTTYVQIIVIDFGKATSTENGKHYHLTEREKAEYVRRYVHMSPEVIEGITRQSIPSDMYAVGGVLQSVVSSGMLTSSKRKALDDLATKCRSPSYLSRPTAKEGLQALQMVV